jgi:DNA modification methylase
MKEKSGFNSLLKAVLQPEGKTFIELWEGDCLEKMKDIPDSTIHLVLTDPPYFIDGLGEDWNNEKLMNRKSKAGVVGGLPVGMKFDPQQGINFQKFFEQVSKQVIRVLVPGGFFLSFSQPRLSHRMMIAAENSGFEIRDLFAWHYTRRAQFKAFSQEHFVRKMALTDFDKRNIIRKLQGRKTPQLRPQFEAIMLAQKPKEGTFVDNWIKWGTGLIDAKKTLEGTTPTTIMTVEKPEKEKYNCHLTVKPVKLLVHLIELFSKRGQVVLDPFLGSGSTALAALHTERSCIGIEINKEYFKIAQDRIKQFKKGGNDDKAEANG